MKRYSEIAGDGGSGIMAQVTEKMTLLNKRMSRIRYKVAVMSGKGGVGKSTITAALAANMASLGFKTGILDADLNGPSIPKLAGAGDSRTPAVNERGVSPPGGALGIKVMSTGLLLPSFASPVTWDGPSSTYPWISAIEATALRELLSDTDWGELDFLFIDMPPVLSRLNDLAGLLPDMNGVVIVTLPSEISRMIVLKSINRVKELNLPILGIIENMSGFSCARCGHRDPLFMEEDMREAFEYLNVPYLGSVPFDKGLSLLSKIGLKEYMNRERALPGEDIFKRMSARILGRLKNNEQLKYPSEENV